MPTPSSGPIAFSDIAWIVYRSYTAQISLNDANVRYLLGVGSGQISMSSAYNKPASGSANYTSPGTYTFLCPAYQNISIDVRAGGGGGGSGGYCLSNFSGIFGNAGGGSGAAGGNSSFGGSIIANGGGGGGGGGGCYGGTGATGTSGGGSGGSVTNGGGAGGGAGGGPNACCLVGAGSGGTGGPGGRTTQSYIFAATAGHPSWGTNYTVVVGAGGAGNAPNNNVNPNGSPGAAGAVYISWS